MTDTATPALGQHALDGAKKADDDLELWSVTTIIGALEKPALLFWSAEQTALAAVHSEKTWRAMLADDEPECRHVDASCDAVKWLRDARFRKPRGIRSATELGTLVHAACEEYAITGVRPEVDDEVRPFLEQFDQWCQRFQPEYQAAEVTIYSPTYGYAGTCDAFLTVGGVSAIVDYKSTRKTVDARGNPTSPYPESVALQLAAYRWGEGAAVWRPRRFEKWRRRYYLLAPAEQAMAVPVPEVDTGLVIHITPEDCQAYPINCDREVHDAFLYTLECHRWLQETSKTVMGKPLEVS